MRAYFLATAAALLMAGPAMAQTYVHPYSLDLNQGNGPMTMQPNQNYPDNGQTAQANGGAAPAPATTTAPAAYPRQVGPYVHPYSLDLNQGNGPMTMQPNQNYPAQ